MPDNAIYGHMKGGRGRVKCGVGKTSGVEKEEAFACVHSVGNVLWLPFVVFICVRWWLQVQLFPLAHRKLQPCSCHNYSPVPFFLCFNLHPFHISFNRAYISTFSWLHGVTVHVNVAVFACCLSFLPVRFKRSCLEKCAGNFGWKGVRTKGMLLL